MMRIRDSLYFIFCLCMYNVYICEFKDFIYSLNWPPSVPFVGEKYIVMDNTSIISITNIIFILDVVRFTAD